MNWNNIYRALVAVVAVLYPGGTMLITKTDDTTEIRSPMLVDPRSLDHATRYEKERRTYKLELGDLENRARMEQVTPFDWYQPPSQPIFKRHAFVHDAYFGPDV